MATKFVELSGHRINKQVIPFDGWDDVRHNKKIDQVECVFWQGRLKQANVFSWDVIQALEQFNSQQTYSTEREVPQSPFDEVLNCGKML